MYKALAHPENNGYVRPYTLQERLAHVKEAQRTLGSGFTWICDAIDNPIKHAMGNSPNSEFVIDGEGRVVRKRSWSDVDSLRADLEELVGPVENPTDPADVQLATQSPPKVAARGVVKRIELPSNLRALVIEPKIEPDGQPFYAKLRAEADSELLSSGKGQLYIRFMMDPLYHVHWNNLVEPIRVQFVQASGGEKPQLDSRVKPGEWTGPEVKEPADIDPREFLAMVEMGESRDPLKLVVKYFACNDEEGWCRPVTQVYTVRLEGDRDGGRRTGGGRGRRPGAGGRGDLAGRPGFGGRPDFGRRPGFGGRRPDFGGRRPDFGGRRPGFGGERPERGPATAAFGRLAKVDPTRNKLLIETRGGGKQPVQTTDKTRVERNRKPAKLSDLKPGDRIVIRYESAGDEPVTATVILASGK
ncbi:MAG: hypothetical protein VX877_00815 [Planctomycetota bacterium]|nr:hypothetical protein [Planctomycetota bacterium]MEE3364623.1 hypothetical protein [Planctomycetota bacterium]